MTWLSSTHCAHEALAVDHAFLRNVSRETPTKRNAGDP